MKYILIGDIQIAGHSFLWNVICEKQVECCPMWQTLVDPEVRNGSVEDVLRAIEQSLRFDARQFTCHHIFQ
jgi:hypothetical protein